MLDRFSKKIEAKMRSQGTTRFLSLEFFLYLVSRLYGAGVNLRNACHRNGWPPSKTLPCMVISVGNLTVGGTGKTPLVIYLSKMIQRLGYNVAVVSRGYKGAAEKSSAIVSDGRSVLSKPDTAGDEPYMIATALENIPVLVGKKRFEVGMIAIEAFDPDVIILDDAFQHLGLTRDLDLVLLDAERPFGNEHLFPRGTLREPMGSLERGDAIILTRAEGDVSATIQRLENMAAARPIFRSFHTPKVKHVIGANSAFNRAGSETVGLYGLKFLQSTPVFAFSGIARNDVFRDMLIKLGLEVNGFKAFPDHHDYSDKELALIPESAGEAGCRLVVTTEKDFVKISERINWPIDLVVLGIETAFGDDTNRLSRFVKSRLSAWEIKKA